MEIQVINGTEKIEILSLEPLPGKPLRYQIDVIPLKLNKIYHRKISIRPKDYFENQSLIVRIYYQGISYDNEIFISLQSSKL